MKRYSCSRIGRLNIVKMSVLPNLVYRYNAAQIKIPESYFVDINKLILKLIWRSVPYGVPYIVGFVWRSKRPRTANTMLKKNTVEDSHSLTSGLIIKLQ